MNIKENGKAYFRLGQAFFHFNKFEEAIKNLDKAVPLLPGDDTGFILIYYKSKMFEKLLNYVIKQRKL